MEGNHTDRSRRYYRWQHWWSSVGQTGVTYGCETTLGIKEESAIWTCVPTLETDSGVILQAEVPGLNSKLEYGYKLGAGLV